MWIYITGTNVAYANGSKSPQSDLLNCLVPPFVGHAGCAGRDGARTPPMAGANETGAALMGWEGGKLGAMGAMGMDGATGAGGRDIL